MPANPDQVPVVAVASGKGGVGKTTVAVNIALALGALGVRVGLVGSPSSRACRSAPRPPRTPTRESQS